MTSNISSRVWRRRPSQLDGALQISTTILLSLFLPLSFLLLARLSAAQSHFYYDYFNDINGASDDFLAFLFLYFNLALLYLLLSFLAVAAFVRGLTGGRVALIQLLLCRQQSWAAAVDDQGSCRRCPLISVAWLLLCTSVVFAELCIEFQLNGDQRSSDYHRNRFLNSTRGLLFALGLYETMLHWSESVVEPVVEDVVVVMMGFTSGGSGEKGEIKKRRRWVERVCLGLSFGALWWWRLRDQADSLVVVPAADDDDPHPHVVLKVADFVSLGLYYLTLFSGALRAFTGVTWMMQLTNRRRKITTPPPAAAVN